MRRLAVLGSPIEHSLSPVLQNTAFGILGLDFDYGRAEVAAGGLPAFLAGLDNTPPTGRPLDESWLGLSLTMPLKREVIPLLDESSPLVRRLGVANTLVFSYPGDGRRHLAGHNTDVDGIVRAIRSQLRPGHAFTHRHAAVLGGGATAVSALAASRELGADHVTVYLRDPGRSTALVTLARELALDVTVAPFAAVADAGPLDFVISTLPGGSPIPALVPSGPDAVLLDVAYAPWPSATAAAWSERGGLTVSGLDMLVEQAIGQIRLFTGSGQDDLLPDEEGLRRALRDSVGLDTD